ncbi:MAG: helix-turn-helix domain-containing protein [Rickettsiales bacterium]|jgi:hypothetical protein|nr:helix-turn-helix domain-containing protein [Rickettsiales bacterium]
MQDFITTKELAAMLKIKTNTIERWRTMRECPIPWTNIRRRVLYALSDVQAYLNSQKRDRVMA